VDDEVAPSELVVELEGDEEDPLEVTKYTAAPATTMTTTTNTARTAVAIPLEDVCK
jgi:hypothetical protein